MHTFLEGVTRHFLAYVMVMMVMAGWCTEQQLRQAVVTHSYSTIRKLASPKYLPSSLFTHTKVTVPAKNGQPEYTCWGPHKEAKVPFSAYQTLIFTIHSLEIFRPFVPTSGPLPAWWMAHVQLVALTEMMMRLSFTYATLLQLSVVLRQWQAYFYMVPEYTDCWRPKMHWATHLALDIYRYGPCRLLWCMIMEMKNREFKLALKRSNYSDPVKSGACFWVDQSEYQMKKKRKRVVCSSVTASVIGGGFAADLRDAPEARALESCLPAVEGGLYVEYVSEVLVRRIQIESNGFVILTSSDGDQVLCQVAHLMRQCGDVDGEHFVCLTSFESLLAVDANGRYFAPYHELVSGEAVSGRRVLSMSHCALTALWHYVDVDANQIRFIVKW